MSENDIYTGWCDVEDQESNRRRNYAILEQYRDRSAVKDLEKAAEQAERFIRHLKDALDKRRKTVSVLRDIANELDRLKEKTDVARLTGSAAAVAGGALAAAGGLLTVFTFGAAGPLVAVGLSTAIAGGVASGGAEIAEAILSKDKLKEAQKHLDEDKKAMTVVDDIYAHLQQLAENLSRSHARLGSKDQILCSLLVSNKFTSHQSKNYAITATACALVCVGFIAATTLAKTTGKQSARIASKIGPNLVAKLLPKMAGIFAKGTVETAGGIAKTVLRGAAAAAVPVILAFDVYELVNASISIHNGSKSEAAKTLRDIARGYEEMMVEMEKFLAEQSALATNLDTMLKMQLSQLLEEMSCKSELSDEDVAEVWRYFEIGVQDSAWNVLIMKLVNDLHALVLAITRIFKYIKPKIEEEATRNKGKEIDLTFIAHGEVKRPMLPCKLHYMNSHVMSITLYIPWGCALDATAAYGIATGMITTANVRYSGIVLPGIPSYWNTLPNDYTEIPEVVFSRVKQEEGAYKSLLYLASVIQASGKGIVIPYFQPPGVADLPEVPLWALSIAVALVGWIFDVKFKVHIASCLLPYDAAVCTHALYKSMWPAPTIDCSQYCTVPIIDPPIDMSMVFNVPSELIPAFNALNKALGIDMSRSDA